MLSANVGIESSSASAFGLVSSGTLSWSSYVLPDRLTAHRYRVYLEPSVLEDVPVVVRHRFWFEHDGYPARCG
jgi:hypothetical protein